jgi:hypothetical protein
MGEQADNRIRKTARRGQGRFSPSAGLLVFPFHYESLTQLRICSYQFDLLKVSTHEKE